MDNNYIKERSKHRHSHGSIDPSIASTKKGIWAVKWSFIILMITFLIQVVIVFFTGSVALLADTIHNLGDAVTAIPLGIAFLFALRKPSKRFTYGFGRVEDLAGVIIVMIILFSAIVAGYQAVDRIIHPISIRNIWAVMLASIIGFIGNEGVAIFRIKVGKEMEVLL
jgi:cation diffusion facilitator family transporter